MSGWRPAEGCELSRIWPAVRAARIFADSEQFRAFRDAGPWRVRVNRRGDAAVLDRWRAHLDVLAIRALWAPGWELGVALADIRGVARAHGFGRVLSPLAEVDALEPYLEAGMVETERIIALQGEPGHIARNAAPDPVRSPAVRRIEIATGDERALPSVYALDARSFSDFWRYTSDDPSPLRPGTRLALAISGGVAASAFGGGGDLLGYTLATSMGSQVTIARLAVAEHARRMGIGSALLADVALWAQRQGAETLTLTTQEDNAASRALYARAGFTELPGRYAFAIDPVAEDGKGGA